MSGVPSADSASPPQNVHSRASRLWWFALLCPCFIPCLPRILGPYVGHKHDPAAVLARIPIGSKLSQLDKYLIPFYDSARVDLWIPLKGEPKGATTVTTEFGRFVVKELARYDAWQAPPEVRDSFTGQIFFGHFCWIVPDDIAPSYAVLLVYVNGILKKKSWAGMPG